MFARCLLDRVNTL